MGFSIYVGQAVVDPDDDGEALRVKVQREKRPDAPTFPGDARTGNTNGRHLSYGAWGDFCDATGLRELFFDEGSGLMREHPGCVRVTLKHLKTVQIALAKWRTMHPGVEPKFSDDDWMCPAELESARVAAHLVRLIWLEWWMRWALETCSLPAICNR